MGSTVIILPEVLPLPDGRTLIYGMDPTLTLCPHCREPISEDYTVIVVNAYLGCLVHARCLSDNVYEQALLGHPPIEAFDDHP